MQLTTRKSGIVVPAKPWDRYRGIKGQPFVDSQPYFVTSLEVLPFLVGTEWGEVALAYVQSLDPTYLLVTTGREVTARPIGPGHVKVLIDENDIILSIEHDVAVGVAAWEYERRRRSPSTA